MERCADAVYVKKKARAALQDEARRLEAAAGSLGAEEYGRVVDIRIRLALARGDLARVERLLDESDAPQKSLIRSAKLAPVAARLDALAALGKQERIEAEAPALLQPQTYLEPFALRALAIVRKTSACSMRRRLASTRWASAGTQRERGQRAWPLASGGRAEPASQRGAVEQRH